jgi:transcription antitermination factor NusG
VNFWAVVNTHPQSEGKAQLHCERQGFQCYAPAERVITIRKGRKIELQRRLFPRYVFVWIDRRWHCLMSTFGVARVLLNGEEPGRIQTDWVEKLMASEVDGAVVLPKQTFRVGDPVVIEGGVFHGCRGLYQGQTGKQREVVLLEQLGRVELASGCLRF